MKLVWLPAARRHRREQIVYIAERNPRAALVMADTIRSAIRRLKDHPEIGHAGRVPGTREMVVPRTPFIVIYTLERDTICILRLLHTAQRWPLP